MTLHDENGGWGSGELERAGLLARELRARVGADSPLFAVRAPGRVNLIGEHTDYSGLPVLPVAIDRATLIVAAPSNDFAVNLANTNLEFAPRNFPLARTIPAYPAGDWGNYPKAAVQGVIDHFVGRGASYEKLLGATMIIDSRVPPAAGLSSSSALTVACALAFMAVNRLKLPPIECAAMIAQSERYVGTMGGAMDQTVSIMGERDHALFIEFNPLRARAVKMPPAATLIVADSGESANKSGAARAEYNRRVVECSLAARIIARALGLRGVTHLGDLVRAHRRWSAARWTTILERAAPSHLKPDLVEAAQILGIARERLAADLLGVGPAAVTLNPARPLEILRRARHVLTESERVLRAVATLLAGDLDAMGTLMNASHDSLARDFDCSTDRLDQMVAVARKGGALGARLTGAGFGGSIVALCRTDDAARVIAALDREFYRPRGIDSRTAREILHAGPGAGTIELAVA